MSTDNHAFDEEILKLHVKASSTSGGACLNRHESPYTPDNSCSHRWQGWKKAKEDSNLYNYPAYASLCKGTVQQTFTFLKGGALKKLVTVKRPSPGDWDLDGTTFGLFPNFRKWARFPYLHNTHHLIPNSVLNNSIYEAAEQKKSPELFTLLRQGLLKAKYNLNYKDNTIILPLSKAVAKALKLPRHISGSESEPGVQPEYTDHKAYSFMIRGKIDKIINSYVGVLDKPTEDHKKEPSDLSKSQLESLSRRIYGQLKRWGKTMDGRSLTEAPDWIVGN